MTTAVESPTGGNAVVAENIHNIMRPALVLLDDNITDAAGWTLAVLPEVLEKVAQRLEGYAGRQDADNPNEATEAAYMAAHYALSAAAYMAHSVIASGHAAAAECRAMRDVVHAVDQLIYETMGEWTVEAAHE